VPEVAALGTKVVTVYDIGYLRGASRSADMLYSSVERRYDAQSVAISTNLAFRQGSIVFPGLVCFAALVDCDDFHGSPSGPSQSVHSQCTWR
jgi:DNA replication protein DnaC